MIDRYIIPYIKPSLRPLVNFLMDRGISANQITIAGFLLGVIAVPLIATEQYIAGLIFILLNRICDGLDGIMARETQPTNRGAFLDITLDFFFYALIPLAFAFAREENALAAAFLLASFIGTGTSFLAFSVIAERQKLNSTAFPQKGIYYLGGLTEGAETIGFFILICLFPNYFPVLATIFALACFFTAGLRVFYGYKQIEK